jgi:hypothetical protein
MPAGISARALTRVVWLDTFVGDEAVVEPRDR